MLLPLWGFLFWGGFLGQKSNLQPKQEPSISKPLTLSIFQYQHNKYKLSIKPHPHKGSFPGLTKVKPMILPRLYSVKYAIATFQILRHASRERESSYCKSQSSEIAFNKMQHTKKGNPNRHKSKTNPNHNHLIFPTLVITMAFNNKER